MKKLGKRVFTFIKLKKEKGFTVSKELIEMVKDQKKMRTTILSTLKSGPKTIPEIANETGLEQHIVTWYLMTYLKYRIVKPDEENEEGFWKYSLVKVGGE